MAGRKAPTSRPLAYSRVPYISSQLCGHLVFAIQLLESDILANLILLVRPQLYSDSPSHILRSHS